MPALLLALLVQEYHVDAEKGDDAAAGTLASPWKSLTRVNAAQHLLKPGDRVLFRRGQVFRGPLLLEASGLEGRPITYASYGDGPRPEITGFVAVSGWTRAGPRLWRAVLPAGPAKLQALSVDGLLRPLGRTPNEGYLTVDAHAGRGSITDADLPEGDWTGAELVLRKVRWVIDRCRVEGQTGRTLRGEPVSSYEPVDGHGYFLQNHPRTLDAFGEWHLDPSTRALSVVLDDAEPPPGRVKASVVDILISAQGRHDLAFEGLRLSGANRAALALDRAARIRLRDCAIVASGVDALRGGRVDGLLVEDVGIEDTNNNAIHLDDGASRCVLRRVTVRATGMRPGMGGSGDGTYNAITLLGGSDNLIEDFTITDTGYLPVHFGGSRITVRDGFIQGYASVKDDAGGIYTWTGADAKTPTTGRKILGNLILDGRGAPAGALGATKAFGIYLDDVASEVEVRGNTVARADAGLFLHNAFRCRVAENTFFDNGVQLLIIHDGIPNAEIRDIAFTDNTLAARTREQGLLWATSLSEDFARFGGFERNLYARPADPELGVRLGIGDRRPRAHDLAGWRALTGLDGSSRMSKASLRPSAIRPAGPELVSAGDFAKDVKNASCWSASGASELAWVEGKLDGGCLHHRYKKPSDAPQTSLLMLNAGPLRAGRRYLLTFSVLGTAERGSAGVRLREGAGPWGPLTEALDVRVDTTRREAALLFTPPRDQAASIIEWSFNEGDGTLWLDNVSLREAEEEAPDPAAFKLLLNPDTREASVKLDGDWTDLDGRPAGGSVKLPPRGSRVLIRQAALR